MAYAGIEPNSTIIFYKDVLSDNTYENAYFFTYEAEQESFFADTTKVLMTLSNKYYQRSNKGTIKVGWTSQSSPEMYLLYGSPINALYNASYMAFTNTSYENKKFYAFVNSVEYINDSTVLINYQIDVIRTWYFQYTSLSGEKRIIPTMCLIEREHTHGDSIGQHTLPEPLETGPYFTKSVIYQTPFIYTPCVAVFCALEEGGPGGQFIEGRNSAVFSKYFTGVSVQTFPLSVQGLNDLITLLDTYVEGNKVDKVVAIVMMPTEFAVSSEGYSSPRQIVITGNTTLGNNYSPRNRKLLTHPFNILYCTTNNGNTAEYRWENFTYFNGGTVNTVNFKVWGNCSPTPSLILYPNDYNGVAENLDEAFIMDGFPLCSFSYDAYKAWLAQNAGSLAAGMANAVLGSVMGGLGAVSGNVLGTAQIAGGVSHVISTLGKMYDYSTKPAQVKGESNGNIIYQSGVMKYDFYYKVIKQEYAEIIDGFFDMYGYKVNRIGYPVLNQRPCYTYLKTVGCELNGTDIPAEAEREIKSIFDKGIRFWLDKTQIGVYGSSRTIPNTPQGE